MLAIEVYLRSGSLVSEFGKCISHTIGFSKHMQSFEVSSLRYEIPHSSQLCDDVPLRSILL